jgi:hypothetical protein
MLVDANEDGMYTQHYFDSRGTFGLWKAPEPVVPVWELRMITRLRRGC